MAPSARLRGGVAGALLAAFVCAVCAGAASITRTAPAKPSTRRVAPATGTLKDTRGQGLRITPPNGSRVRPGQTLTVTVEPLPGTFPGAGVDLSAGTGIQHDPTAPYTFEITIPSDHLVGLHSVEARAKAGERVLTDRATYVIEGGVPKWVVVTIGVALFLVALYASAIHAFPVMCLASAALLAGGVGLVTGRIRVRPSVEETASVRPGEERYERREVTRGPGGRRAIHTIVNSRTETKAGEEGGGVPGADMVYRPVKRTQPLEGEPSDRSKLQYRP